MSGVLFSGGAGRARVWVYWRSGIFVARTWMLVRRAYAFSVAIFCASALGTERVWLRWCADGGHGCQDGAPPNLCCCRSGTGRPMVAVEDERA